MPHDAYVLNCQHVKSNTRDHFVNPCIIFLATTQLRLNFYVAFFKTTAAVYFDNLGHSLVQPFTIDDDCQQFPPSAVHIAVFYVVVGGDI